MSLPPTSSRKDWPRLVAETVNRLLVDFGAALDRIASLEAYTVDTVTFTPVAEPTSPVEGMTYQDSTTHKLRTYDGTAWQDHW